MSRIGWRCPSLTVAALAAILTLTVCGERTGRLASTGQAAAASPASSAADLDVWREFVTAMKTGGLGPDRVRPSSSASTT